MPDGRHFLYLGNEGNDPKGKLYVASLDSPEATVVAQEQTNAEYANGYLFFVKDGNLVAQPFNLNDLRLSGNPLPVVSNVDNYAPKALGNFSVPQNGVLVYRTAYQTPSRFVWLDRSGKQIGTVGEPGIYYVGRLSPNGHTVALSRPDPVDRSTSDLWLVDVQRGTLSRFTFHPIGIYTAAWSPDGSQLAVGGVSTKIQLMAANGSGSPKPLTENELNGWVADWSADGQTLLLNIQSSDTGWDIFTLPASGRQPLTPIVHSPFDELSPRFSPDGHWLAYGSNESGREEVYVISFPGPGGRWQVSNGASAASVWGLLAWSRDGKQLYYCGAEGELMAADVQLHGNEFHVSVPRQIFSAPGGIEWIDAAPDGRILIRVHADQGLAPPMTLVVNWDQQIMK